MPAIGNGRTSPVIADEVMSGTTDYHAEYILDSDEGSPLPALEFLDSAADTLQILGATAETKSPSVTFAIPQIGVALGSVNSSPDSISDFSSKRTQSAASTKTTLTSHPDVMMSDGIKGEWDYSDFIHNDEDQSLHAFDGTINPSSIENSFSFDERPAGLMSDLASSSSSPSPYDTTGDLLSPQMGNIGALPTAKTSMMMPDGGMRNLSKAYSQYSLTQSMGGLTTSTSREVSPFSNKLPSHDSPPPTFMDSSSPIGPFSFHGLPNMGAHGAGAQWANPFGVGLGHMPQQHGPGGIPMGLSGPMNPSISAPVVFSGSPYGPGAYFLKVHPTPAKSRVETQIPIKLSLSPLPPGIKRLHLPTHTISKPKLLQKPAAEPSPDMLELHTVLVCTSAMQNKDLKDKAFERARLVAQSGKTDRGMVDNAGDEDDKPQNGGEVHICNGCMTRERKRAARKKIKKVEDEQAWVRHESRRVIVFNTQEIKPWQQPNTQEPGPPSSEFQIDAPMRIACYCRHHAEKVGFQVIFTITNHLGQFVAQALSPSIMITDDHKTTSFPQMPTVSAPASEQGTLPLQSPGMQQHDQSALGGLGGPFRLTQSSSDLQALKRNVSVTFPPSVVSTSQSQATSAIPTPRNLSRPASPSAITGPSSKKRKASGSSKIPSELTMTRLETSQLPASHGPNQGLGPSVSPSTASFSPSLATLSAGTEQAMFASPPIGNVPMAQPFATGPPTPNSNDQTLFTNMNRSTSFDNLTMAQMYSSAPASAHHSRAPSPSSLGASTSTAPVEQQNSQLAQALANNLFSTIPVSMSSSTTPNSTIHKIIPSEGPKSGGIEVTILGSGFYQGLEVMFGDIKATTTTFWGESSLVCLLPPSPVQGGVRVSFKQQNLQSPRQFHKPQPIFNYIDDDEQQLMRTALTVLGQKMTGVFEDVTDIARRIIGGEAGLSGAGSISGTQRSGTATFNNFMFADGEFENNLLKVLELIDYDDSTHKARLNLRRMTGQTMLHLACSLGLNRFVAGLLVRGVNLDLRDKGGYTPLHMAALNDHPEIVRRLIYHGADPTLRTLSGLTAADVSQSRAVLRALKRVERHARSRSGGSLHSRASSANSLKSLWDPLALTQTASAPPSSDGFGSDESPEYTSGDLLSDEEDADANAEPWLDMRRSSVHDISVPDKVPSLLQPSDAHVAGGLASPSAAVVAFKEQFATQLQQFQQTMAVHLQNLPQFPYLPQMPNMSPLPDYQAAVMQRLAAMVPNIGGARPGSSGEQPPKDLDFRWWDLSSLMPSSAPPPAYEEIFPQNGDLDTKQQSAAQAAAEAEADQKCAALYDQPAAPVTTTEAVMPKLPALLQIGRKNAITKEQQDNLRRAHAERLKRLSRDRNLFFVWIPLLVVVLCAMLFNRFPGLFTAVWSFVSSQPLGNQIRPAQVVELA